jgi:uncharacterized protein YbcI
MQRVVPEPTPPSDEHSSGGELNAAISKAVVKIQRDYLGRGPTKARTSIRDNTVVVLLEDTLTKAERSLVLDGKEDEVLVTRGSLQRTMRRDMEEAVAALTGREVVAFMSTNHIDPDLACEVFVVAPDPFDENHLADRAPLS